jgi:hypothetical protein
MNRESTALVPNKHYEVLLRVFAWLYVSFPRIDNILKTILCVVIVVIIIILLPLPLTHYSIYFIIIPRHGLRSRTTG